MRKCIRCKCEMRENYDVKVEGGAYGLKITKQGIFKDNLGKVRVAVCPECGYLEFYLEDTSKLKNQTTFRLLQSLKARVYLKLEGIGHYKREKLICNIFAEAGAFTVMVRLTNKQCEAINERKGMMRGYR